MSQSDNAREQAPSRALVLDIGPEGVERVERAEGAKGAEETETADLDTRARDFARRLLDLDPEHRHEGRDAVERMGRPLQEETARRSEMLRTPLHELAGHADDGGPVASSLLELRQEVEKLDPNRFDLEPGWAMRLIGKIPGVGTPVKRYFQRFESAQDALDAIDRSLVKGRAELERDNVTLTADQKEMQRLNKRLEDQTALGRALDAALVERIEEARTHGTRDPEPIETDLLFPLRQRLMDLEQQRAVTQQGIMASDIIRRNNVELIRAVDRARNVTMNALQVAVTVALALSNQKLVLDKVAAVNTATSSIIAANAQRLKDQGAAIHAQASSTMLDMNALKSAFRDIHETMEAIATHRRKALPEMASALVELDTMTRKGEQQTAQLPSQGDLDAQRPKIAHDAPEPTATPHAQSGSIRPSGLLLCTALALAATLLAAGCDEAPKTGQAGQTGKTGKIGTTYDPEVAGAKLAKMAAKVPRNEDTIPDWRERVRMDADDPVEATLPDLETFDLAIDPEPCGECATADIIASTEKAGSGVDGWMVDVARAFNESARETTDGRRMQIAIRAVPSGTAYQMIAAGKAEPDAFSPSNHLWIAMLEARGIAVEAIAERLVANTAGIVMRTATHATLETQARGETVAARHVVEAVNAGEIAMGYTNPFASSTGLNFLMTVLDEFAQGDPDRLLSDDVTSAFTTFQRSIPFIALTTLQMRASVERGGRLDAFVMERQTFENTASLEDDYVFVPFGIVHDNPLYMIAEQSPAIEETLEAFARHATSTASRELATGYGFDDPDAIGAPAPSPYPGRTLIAAQQLWKKHKRAGRPVSAVFVADVSGSMRGTRLEALKHALRAGVAFIKPENAIGLVEFNDRITIRLPIAPFDLNQQGTFLAAVEEMQAQGGTAMYNAVLIGIEMLSKAKNDDPSIQPILFVLSDGETKSGYRYGDVDEIVKAMQIPIYTIGYEADIETLTELSALVEAASLKGTEERIAHQIGTLLNAQM